MNLSTKVYVASTTPMCDSDCFVDTNLPGVAREVGQMSFSSQILPSHTYIS